MVRRGVLPRGAVPALLMLLLWVVPKVLVVSMGSGEQQYRVPPCPSPPPCCAPCALQQQKDTQHRVSSNSSSFCLSRHRSCSVVNIPGQPPTLLPSSPAWFTARLLANSGMQVDERLRWSWIELSSFGYTEAEI